MNVADRLFDWGKRKLSKSVSNAANENRWIYEEVFGASECDGNIGTETAKRLRYILLVIRRAGGEPLQYLLGSAPFFDMMLKVGRGVLIPRFDTECVAQKAAELMPKAGSLLELCSGSGCIAIAVTRLTGCKTTAIEISRRAVRYLKENAAEYAPQISIVRGDALQPQKLPEGRYDVICANPPYINETEMSFLQREVRREPRMALYGGKDGLFFYRKISELYRCRLNNGGYMVFEVGAGQADSVKSIFSEYGYKDIGAARDISGTERVVYAKGCF